MKAIEYANRYFDSSDKDKEFVKIVRDFLNEISEVMRLRNVKVDSGLFSIIDEQIQKWRSFAEKINTSPNREHKIDPEGFIKALKATRPEVCDNYLLSKKVA